MMQMKDYKKARQYYDDAIQNMQKNIGVNYRGEFEEHADDAKTETIDSKS